MTIYIVEITLICVAFLRVFRGSILDLLTANLQGAAKVARAAKFESEDVMYAFFDDVMAELKAFDLKARRNLVKAEDVFDWVRSPPCACF